MASYLTIVATFKLKPGRKAEYLALLHDVLAHAQREPYFVNTIVHSNPEDRDQVVLYEIWAGTKDRFLTEEIGKRYRREYLQALDHLIETLSVAWLTPDEEWGRPLLATE